MRQNWSLWLGTCRLEKCQINTLRSFISSWYCTGGRGINSHPGVVEGETGYCADQHCTGGRGQTFNLTKFNVMMGYNFMTFNSRWCGELYTSRNSLGQGLRTWTNEYRHACSKRVLYRCTICALWLVTHTYSWHVATNLWKPYFGYWPRTLNLVLRNRTIEQVHSTGQVAGKQLLDIMHKSEHAQVFWMGGVCVVASCFVPRK